jgi:hypothetical protein
MSVALVIQHAKRMRHSILSSVACLAVPYFSTLSHKRHDCRKIYWTLNVFWFSLQLLSETFVILRRIQRDITINVHRPSREVPVIRVRFWLNLNFLDRFSKNTQISNLIKIRPVGAELFHADGRTDIHKYAKADSRFSKFFFNVHKNQRL